LNRKGSYQKHLCCSSVWRQLPSSIITQRTTLSCDSLNPTFAKRTHAYLDTHETARYTLILYQLHGPCPWLNISELFLTFVIYQYHARLIVGKHSRRSQPAKPEAHCKLWRVGIYVPICGLPLFQRWFT